MTDESAAPSAEPMPYNVMDFVAISGSGTVPQTLADTVELARTAERLGYKRFWVPEHHNHAGLAFTSPEVMIAHLAARTDHIRVGAAGIMLPNHAPLKVAEVFRTLEALHPGRIDLGLGRAPGTDGLTAFALRGRQDVGDFPPLAGELLAFLDDGFPEEHPYAQVLAAPVGTGRPEIFMLGSSEYGPHFAAVNGLRAVFAHHMSPELAAPVLRRYRADFQPSVDLASPYSIVSTQAFATDDQELADAALATWALFVDQLRSGRRGPRAGLDEAIAFSRTDEFARRRESLAERMFVGPAAEVAEGLRELARRCEVDEVTLISPLGLAEQRAYSFELLAKELGLTASLVS